MKRNHFLEIPHLFKVFFDRLETLNRLFLVESLEKRDIRLEIFVEITNIDEGPKNAVRENHLERLPILLNRVKEPETSETMELQLMLYLYVLRWTLYVLLRCLTQLVECWTVLHQDLTNNMSTM